MTPSFFLPRLFTIAATSLLVTAIPSAALAAPDDGVYGRFDSPWSASVATGVGDASSHVFFHLELNGHYLQTAGAYLYAEPTTERFSGAIPQMGAGISARPLFLPRFFKNWEQGPAWLDLLIDSFELRVGMEYSSLRRAINPLQPSFVLGVAVGTPLQSNGNGFWFRATLMARWPHDSARPNSPIMKTILCLSYDFIP